MNLFNKSRIAFVGALALVGIGVGALQAAQLIQDSLTVQGAFDQSQGTNLQGTGVNRVSIAGAATGSAPAITCGGASVDTNCSVNVAGTGTGIAQVGNLTTCTAADTVAAVCNAQRFVATFTAVTVASDTVKAETVTNNKAVSTSVPVCTLQSFTGTITTNGIPYIQSIVPTTGSLALNIANSGANTTGSQSFVIDCVVF